MEIVKGGWTFDRVPYQPAVRRFISHLAQGQRQLITLSDYAERGARFNSDDALIARLESHYSEEEFMACPRLAINIMLDDCAKSDYWYEHEKTYEDAYSENEENEDE